MTKFLLLNGFRNIGIPGSILLSGKIVSGPPIIQPGAYIILGGHTVQIDEVEEAHFGNFVLTISREEAESLKNSGVQVWKLYDTEVTIQYE